MKALLLYFLCFQLVFGPVAFGNQFLEDAKEAVSVAKKRAQFDGEALSSQDFLSFLMEIKQSFQNYSEEEQNYVSTMNEAGKLESLFDELVKSLNSNQKVSHKLLKALKAKYQKASFIQFKAAWSKDDLNSQLHSSFVVLDNIISKAKYRCEYGSSESEKTYQAPSLPIPDYESMFGASLSPNPLAMLNKRFPFQVDLYYASATAGSTAANEDRNKAVAAVMTYSNAATNAWITSTLTPTLAPTTGLAGSVFSNLVAAAPMALVVAAVVAIVADVLANREAVELAEKIAEANRYTLAESPTYEDVQNAYRESCTNKLDLLVDVSVSLRKLLTKIKSGEAFSITDEQISSLELYEEEARVKSYKERELHLGKMIDENSCLDITEMSEEEAKAAYLEASKNLGQYCVSETNEGLYIAGNTSSFLPMDDTERRKVLEENQKFVEYFNQKYSKDYLKHLMIWKVTQSLSGYSKIMNEFSSYSPSNINYKRKKAFRSIVGVITLWNKSKSIFKTKALDVEDKLQSKFASIQVEYNLLVQEAILSIYQYSPSQKKEFEARLKAFVSKSLEFLNPLLHTKKAVRLKMNLMSLQSEVVTR